MDYDQENQFPAVKKDNQKPPAESESSGKQLGSGEGKLWIKLKIQKVEEEDQIGIRLPQRNDQPRVCNVCNKGFSSGKALGGHMRIHVQANKEQLILKKKAQFHHQLVNVSENRDYDNNAVNGRSSVIDRPTCSLCGKNFPSMKSLFGHMRCHPEREWRGIQPPPPPPPPTAAKNSSSSSSSVSDQKLHNQTDSDGDMAIPEIDLSKSLLRWSATAKRGRRALTTTAAASPPVSEEELLRDAVDDLMRLAQGDSLESGLTNKHRVVEATNSNSLTNNKVEIEEKNRVFQSKKRRRIDESPVGFKKLKIEEKGSSDLNHSIGTRIDISRGVSVSRVSSGDNGKGKARLETEFITEKPEDDYKNFTDGDGDDESESKNSDCSIPSEQLIMNYKCEKAKRPVTIMNKKKRKKLNLKDLGSARHVAPIDQIHRYYKCSTCNKIFSTHQALGGHRSSHNKAKNSHTTIDESSSAAAEDETKENEGAGSSKPAAESEHQQQQPHRCKICNKNFATGQALGGHKRCHWTGGPVEAPSSQATSPGEASQTGRKILGFDLNELPAMEEDEEGGFESEEHAAGYGYGYGYASSSYNNSVS